MIGIFFLWSKEQFVWTINTKHSNSVETRILFKLGTNIRDAENHNLFIFLSTGHTYVKAQSPHLDRTVRQAVTAFSNELCRNSGTNNGSGQISLEFFQKKKGWIYQEDIPWEVWTIRCKLVQHGSEQERLGERVKVEEMLSEKVLYICQEMNKHGYVPKMPKQADQELVFDTTYPNISPYLFKISHTTSSMSNSPSMGTAVQRLISPLLGL